MAKPIDKTGEEWLRWMKSGEVREDVPEDIKIAIETFIKGAIMIEEEGLEYMPTEYMTNLLKAFANHPENQTAQECLIFLLKMFGSWEEDEKEFDVTDIRELFEDLPEAYAKPAEALGLELDLSEEALAKAGRVGQKEDIDGPFYQWTVRQWWDLGKSPLAKYYDSFYTDEIREKVRELYQPDFDLIAQAKE